jgi:hypothetical protein
MSQLRTHLARYLSDETHVRSARRLLATVRAPIAGAHEFLAEEQVAVRRWGESWALTSLMAFDGEIVGDCFCHAGRVIDHVMCQHLAAFAWELQHPLNDDVELADCASRLEQARTIRFSVRSMRCCRR